MKQIYGISRGQLLATWVFGIILFLVFLNQASNFSKSWASIGAVVLPFFLIFYTLGWRSQHKRIGIKSRGILSKFKQNEKIVYTFPKERVIPFILLSVSSLMYL